MNSTFLPPTSSPTRCMRGRGSPGACNAATDDCGSSDSVTMYTVGASQTGAVSGSASSTGGLPGTGTGSGANLAALSGPVIESKGLRAMIASADGRSCVVVVTAAAISREGGALVTGPDNAAPIRCVAPAAWKYAASATNASTTPRKYFLSRKSKLMGPSDASSERRANADHDEFSRILRCDRGPYAPSWQAFAGPIGSFRRTGKAVTQILKGPTTRRGSR